MSIVFRTIDDDAIEAIRKAGLTVTPRFHDIAVDYDASITFQVIPGADEKEGFWVLSTGVILQVLTDELFVSTQDAVNAAPERRERTPQLGTPHTRNTWTRNCKLYQSCKEPLAVRQDIMLALIRTGIR